MRKTLFASLLAFGLILCTGWAAMDDSERMRTVDRLADLIPIEEGATIADVGAGDGKWTLQLARVVGSSGRVIATEVSQKTMKKLQKAIRRSDFENIETVMADQNEMGLQAESLDAIHLRFVYHHFDHPEKMRPQMFQALKPGRSVAVIEFEPDGDSHGIEAQEVIEEMKSDGFELTQRVDRWQDRSGRYLLLFRRPLDR